MNLPLKFARRYLASKRSTNAINIITGIAVFGVSIGTAALVLVLSVFNGFEDLITGMYGNFNPDLKIIPAKGKNFPADSVMLSNIRSTEGVAFAAQTVEEVAFFSYKDNQEVGILKGVDSSYNKVAKMDSSIWNGRFRLVDGKVNMAVLGIGMHNKLSININDPFTPIAVYMPKRQETGPLENQFRERFTYPVGAFVIQQDFDNQYVITSIEFARDLLGFDDETSAIELKVEPGASTPAVKKALKNLMGEGFIVKDRYEQEEAFFRLMKMEKWLSFAIVSLMMLMVAFNIVGALWMIVLEKQKDIAILKSMGALDNTVRNIFLAEGLLLCGLGVVVGFLIAIVVVILQKTVGIITIPGDFIIEAYPISTRIFDFLVVAVTVMFIGLLASLPPAMRAKRVPTLMREE